MKVLDLFCGAGGLSKGFEMAGHEVVLGVDIWDVATTNFKINHSDSAVLTMSISDIDPKDLPEVDIIVGGSPCQEFTSLNLKRQPWRGMLNVCHFFRIVEKMKPKYYLMENVIGVQKYLPTYLPRYVLRASDFGCETGRRRLFVTNIPQPIPHDINPNPKKTCVGIDNRNKGHKNSQGEVLDLEEIKFTGTNKEIRQLQANCVIPKVAYEIAKMIKS